MPGVRREVDRAGGDGVSPTAAQIGRALRHTWRMANPWSPMIRDMRGRPCPVFRLDRYWLHGTADLPREEFERIRAGLMRTTHRGLGARPLILWSLAFGYVAFFVWLLSVTTVPRPLIAAIAIVVSCFVWAALTYHRRVPKAGRVLIAAALIREGRCASCAYDLRRTAADADGLVMCPECGAAWRMPRG